MKKIAFILAAALAAIIFFSCNDSSGDYAQNWAFASVKNLTDNDYYFVLDNDKTAYPGDKSRVGGYLPEDGSRVIIYFTKMEVQAPGYDYNIELYYISEIYSGDTKTVTTREELDALPDDRVSYLGSSYSSGKYLNIGVGFYASDLNKHSFTLVRSEINNPSAASKSGYVNLELRHDADGDNKGYSYDNMYVSFRLDEILSEPELVEGIILRVNTRYNGIQYVTIKLSYDR